MADLQMQLKNARLTTARILYHMPDFEGLLQEFIWQDYDLAPKFPRLNSFLEFWSREIDGKLHSVYVAKKELITPGDYRFAEWQATLQ
ncbi:MAG: Usg family protein [Alphaproteobacteria bacterium]|nr:Usg family protein [Alphaproteobacteria bacterium]